MTAIAPNLRPDLVALREEIIGSSPPFLTRRSAVRVLREKVGIEWSARSLERWDLPIQYLRGEAIFPTTAFVDLVLAELNAAPVAFAGRPKSTDLGSDPLHSRGTKHGHASGADGDRDRAISETDCCARSQSESA